LPGLRLELANNVNRFVGRNVRRSLYSLWHYVKDPREDRGKNETQRNKHDLFTQPVRDALYGERDSWYSLPQMLTMPGQRAALLGVMVIKQKSRHVMA
jgi:hypothetical protein